MKDGLFYEKSEYEPNISASSRRNRPRRCSNMKIPNKQQRAFFNDLTMRRSPRRPLILKRRKLPFQQNEPAETKIQHGEPDTEHPFKPDASQRFPDGIRIMDHPSMSDTQVVVIPKKADLQSVIGALTAKGRESGAKGPNKFILLSGNDSSDNESFCSPVTGGNDVSKRSSDGLGGKSETTHSTPEAKSLSGIKRLKKDGMNDSLTNIQWLGKMSTCALDEDAEKLSTNKENQTSASQSSQNTHLSEEPARQPMSERPPYSYMAMIQFAINSRSTRMMTLKEIYMWIEDHFPYYKEVAKPGWKNSIRHNLSLHDMFIRETSLDGKVSYWTIRPEANRCLTLDQVYKPGCDPMTTPVPVPMLVLPHQHQKRILPDARKTPSSSERRMKPLLPRTDSYFVPIQLPVASSLYLPPSSSSSSSSSSPFTAGGPQQRQSSARGAKRVRIAPKVAQSDPPAVPTSPPRYKDVKEEVKEEQVPVPIGCETPKSAPRRPASSSRRKQSLVRSLHEEPVLLCPDNTFLDSGVVSDTSTLQDVREAVLDENQLRQDSPDREFSFKTPIKSNSHLTSSTPSKPPCSVAPEPWRATPASQRIQSVLDFSPIRTPSGPAVPPWFDYTALSFNSTPFKEWPLFNPPGDLLPSPPSRMGYTTTELPSEIFQRSFTREPLLAGGGTPANRSVTEGLVLDTMNDSLSKILVDISFTGLDEDDLGMANISWSEFFPQLK